MFQTPLAGHLAAHSRALPTERRGPTSVDYLRGTQVSDAALEQLKKARNLRSLLPIGTKVTAAGVLKLRGAMPRCRINVGRTMQAEINRQKAPSAAPEEPDEFWEGNLDDSEDTETQM